jgi:hypothetical protein
VIHATVETLRGDHRGFASDFRRHPHVDADRSGLARGCGDLQARSNLMCKDDTS